MIPRKDAAIYMITAQCQENQALQTCVTSQKERDITKA